MIRTRNMASNSAQTGDGRGDSLETRASAPTEEDFSDDSFEYDDEEVIRMRLAAVSNNPHHNETNVCPI